MSDAPKTIPRRWLWLAVTLSVISLGLYGVTLSRQQSAPDPMTLHASNDSRSIASEAIHVSAAVPVPAASPRSPTAQVVSATSVARFQSKFGSDLKIELARDGRLESARGFPGAGTRGSPDFSPSDPQKAIARAREVLSAAREAMDVRDELPLGIPIAKSSATSAQVFFRETVGGVPIAPGGNVTVDLGPQGELLGLYSDYAPGVRVTNERTRTADDLRATASSAVPGVNSAIKPSGGNAIVWVVGSGASAEGRHAYEYRVQGHQVVVDASNGEILKRKDQRDF